MLACIGAPLLIAAPVEDFHLSPLRGLSEQTLSRRTTRRPRARRAVEQIDLLLPPQPSGRRLFPVDLLTLQPVERPLSPFLQDRDLQLRMPDHHPGQRQAGLVVPVVRGPVTP